MNIREEQFAEFLAGQGLAWAFEPIRFQVRESTYLPDFYCPDDDTFYEVVGTTSTYHQNKEKVKKFIKDYPHINFKYVNPDGSPFIYKPRKRKSKYKPQQQKVIFRLDEKLYHQILEASKLIDVKSPSEFIRMAIYNLLYTVLKYPAQVAKEVKDKLND